MTPLPFAALLTAAIIASSSASDVYNKFTKDQLQTLAQDAPTADNLRGVHILLDNDVDTATMKHPVILLSNPRSYKDSQDACASLGEDMAPSSGYGAIASLLRNSPVVQPDIKNPHLFWVSSNDASQCSALDRRSGAVSQLPCSTGLPALCKNTVSRTLISDNDKSKQITGKTQRVGTYQGYRDQNSFRFLGIPYAQAPVNNLRFMAPKQWTLAYRKGGAGTAMDATRFGNVCHQITYGGKRATSEDSAQIGGEQSEDCLFLNVFTPSLKANNSKGLPVMVYIHGGSYTFLSGSSPLFEPGNLVSRGGVVVVTLNYRLSIFGLFENVPEIPRSTAPGNLATRDQIMALTWVKENIGSFGGDPGKVTIFGQSAGAWSVRALLSAPSAFDLYHNAILQSDPIGLPFSSPKVASGFLGAQTMKSLGCKGSDLSCAQSKTVDEIQDAQSIAMARVLSHPENAWIPREAIYRPLADGSLIPADFAELVRTRQFNTKANILWGATRDEYGAFVPVYITTPSPLADAEKDLALLLRDTNRTGNFIRNNSSSWYHFNNSDQDTVRDVLTKAATDLYYICPLQVMSQGVAASGERELYNYMMDFGRSPSEAFGSGIGVPSFCDNRICHGHDLVSSFGSGDLIRGVDQTGDNARFARHVIDRFSVFARTGNPNPERGSPGLASQNHDLLDVQWPPYTAANPIYHFKVTNSAVISDADTARCDWVAKSVKFDFQVHGPDCAVDKSC